MKKFAASLITLLFICTGSIAQVTAKPLSKVATLSMPGETGNNCASVVWHPVQKKYYASFAGNATFPFAVFNLSGNKLSEDDLQARFDVRGMWYNTESKKIEANGYSDFGWINYTLNSNGIPDTIEYLQYGQVQPGEQSAGVFDADKKRVAFLSDGRIVFYSLQGDLLDEEIKLKYTVAKIALDAEPNPFANYSPNTVCYTDIPNEEFAILNITDMLIELYNRKGDLTNAYKILEETPVYENFNFAYANGTWWFFDKNERKWNGYK